MSAPNTHHFVQAPVRPLDQDGIVAGIVGTSVWVLATIVLAWRNEWLASTGHGWWLHTSIAGTTLGIIGTAYCVWRKKRRESASETGPRPS